MQSSITVDALTSSNSHGRRDVRMKISERDKQPVADASKQQSCSAFQYVGVNVVVSVELKLNGMWGDRAVVDFDDCLAKRVQPLARNIRRRAVTQQRNREDVALPHSKRSRW